MIYHLPITPQTRVTVNQTDNIFFRIPEDQLRPEGLKRKRRIERYNKYKEDLFDIAQDNNFQIADEGMDITFCIPVPPSWRPGKKKKHHMRKHQSKPDIDNLLKAFMDALKKADQAIWDFRGLRKVWINDTQGHIEIELP